MRFPFSGGDEPRIQLRDYLREKEILLVLDNFEHLMSGAGIVSDLLDGAPDLKIIVTSRERLNLREEWTYELRGLPVPEPDRNENIEQFGAVQLFLQNAFRVFPEFALTDDEKPSVVDICRLVEGMPLGIELASAWVRALTCGDIAAEIATSRDFLVTTVSNVPERHQSLRAVFENSWNLLTAPERRTLQQLAIFRGGFERDAAREVAGASLSLLLSLADKSLIRRSASGRFEMLETIRQYALEKLKGDDSLHQAVIQRHYLHFASLLQRLSGELTGKGQKGALALSDREVENIREAWRQAVAVPDARALRQALDGFFHLYEIRGWFQEGIEQFGLAASVFSRPEPTAEEKLLHGMLLSRRGWFAFRLGLYEETRRDLLHGLAIFRSLNAHGETAFALYNMGIFTYQLGDYDEAQRYLEESLRLRREVNDRFGVARSLSILGVVARDRGDLQEARELLTESLSLHRDIGDQRGVSRCLNLLALIHHDRGQEQEQARPLLEESLAISREIDDRRGVAFALSILGALIYETGDYIEARALAEESLEIREEIGERRGIAFSLHDLGNIARALDRHEDAWHYLQRALRTAYEIQAVPLVLYVLTGIAELYLARGETRQALRLSRLVLKHPSSFEMAVTRAEALQQKLQTRLESDEEKEIDVDVRVDDLDPIVDELLGVTSLEP
jgi:predicted ATPase